LCFFKKSVNASSASCILPQQDNFAKLPKGAVEEIEKPQEAALDYVREGDALVVTKLDRLARSVSHLVAIGERLEAKGVALEVLDQAIDTSRPPVG